MTALERIKLAKEQNQKTQFGSDLTKAKVTTPGVTYQETESGGRLLPTGSSTATSNVKTLPTARETAMEKKAQREDRYAASTVTETKPATKALKEYNASTRNYFPDMPGANNSNDSFFDIDPDSIQKANDERKKEAELRKNAWREVESKPLLYLGSIFQTLNAAPGVAIETTKQAVSNVKDTWSNDEYSEAVNQLSLAQKNLENTIKKLSEKNASLFPDASISDLEVFIDHKNPEYLSAKKKVEEAQKLVDSLTVDTPVDINSKPMQDYREAKESGERFLEGMNGWQRTAGEIGLSIGQNAATLPTAAISPYLPLAIMGTTASADKMYTLNEQGVSPEESLSRGAISGGIEVLTEKIPLDNILSLARGGNLDSFVKTILKQSGIEATEESVSYVSNYLMDRAYQDPNATFSVDELLKNALGGAVSGGIFSAGGSFVGNARNRYNSVQTANQNLSNPEFVQGTIQSAIDSTNQNINNIPVPDNPLVGMLPTVEDAFTYRSGSPYFRGQETNAAPVQSEVQTDTQSVPETGTLQTAEEFYNRSNTQNEIPIQDRTWQDAGNRKVNAFQYDHPELRPYYKQAAEALKYDLSSAVKGERFPLKDSDGYITGYTGTNRSVTDPVAHALDDANLSYAQIEKALDDLIADNGQENYAAAKKIELVLDEMLSDGYTNSDGEYVQPNEQYIFARDSVGSQQNSALSQEEWDSIMQEEYHGLPTAEEYHGLPTGVGPESSVGAAAYGFDPYSHLQGLYGTIQPGEKPVRTVDAPRRTAPKNKVSMTARTIMEAAATPDAFVPEIAQAIVNGKFSYIPVSNAQRSKMAQSKIERTGYSDALENWRSQVRSGKTSADIIATGAELYNAAVNSGDAKQAMNILYDYTQAVRSGAQATQAARILKTLTPSGKLYMLQKEVNNLNDNQSGKTSKKSSGRENVSALDNVPVEIWMQRVGENLADYLSSRAQVGQQSAKTVSQTILSDLRRFANDTAPKAEKSKNTRTELDRIVDLFQNKEAYNEAWQAAKDTLSDEFRDDPDALSAFDAWLDSSLSYVDHLTNEIAKQNPRAKKLAEAGKISIDEGLAEAYLRATTEEERAIAYDKMVQNIADQIPPDFVDKWNAWRYISMLANPRTHIRNTGGNIFFQPVRITKDRIAAVIEAGVNARGGNIERTKSFIANPSLYKVAWKDWVNVKDSLTGSKYNDLSSEINDRRRIFKKGAPTKALELLTGKEFENGILENIRRGNSYALDFEDTIFKRFTYTDALAGFLQANGVTAEQMKAGTVNQDLLERARAYAGKEALKATYQDRNEFSDLVSRRFRGDSKGAKFGNAAVDAVLPFRRTPANILVRGFEYSPIGLAKSLVYDLPKVKSGKMSLAEAIDNIASGVTGSILACIGYWLLSSGVVSDGGGDDENQDQMNSLTGKQNYALNLPGGGSVTLDWLAPEALPFFMGVELADSLGENGWTADSIFNAVVSISEPMLQLSMLQSLNDLIDSVSYVDSSGKIGALASSALISYFSQGIPTIGGQIERTGQDTRITTYTDKTNWLPTDVQYAIGQASSRVPGWDYQQIPFIDAWGREESTGARPLLRAADNFLNPAYTSTENVTPVDEEIQRLYDTLGEATVIPDRAPRYITVDKKRIDLDADQYVQYAKTRGQTSFELMDQLIESDVYNNMSDKEKSRAVERVYDYADAIGKMAVSDYEPEDWVSEMGTISNKFGLSKSEYLAFISKYGSSALSGDRVKKAYDAGIPLEDYLDYSAQDKDYDQSDGVTQAEKIISIENSGLKQDEKNALYYVEDISEAGLRKWERAKEWGMSEDEYIKFYAIYAASGDGMTKSVKIKKMQEAGMTLQQANYFWNLMKRD